MATVSLSAPQTAQPHPAQELEIKTKSINEEYEVFWREKLGVGISGPVRPCKSRLTGEMFAMKCLSNSTRTAQELRMHYRCSGHPHIVGIIDVYCNTLKFPKETEGKSRLLIVMELMKGGELFERISNKKVFTECEAAKYTRQIALAVQRCHSLDIAHRDIKPENLLLKDDSDDALCKLGDFGFAKLDDGNLMTPKFTPYYVAPQVLEAEQLRQLRAKGYETNYRHTYDKSCDMWSVGVIVYIMLCGYPPFYSENPNVQISKTMRRRILAGQYEFADAEWSHISSNAIDLVTRLLKVNPEERMTAEQVLAHPWLHHAPVTQLQSPAILSDRSSLEEALHEHDHQLTKQRLPDEQVMLKAIVKSKNPLLAKRQQQRLQ